MAAVINTTTVWGANPASTPGIVQPTAFSTLMSAWFAALPLTDPGVAGVWWNNAGIPQESNGP